MKKVRKKEGEKRDRKKRDKGGREREIEKKRE